MRAIFSLNAGHSLALDRKEYNTLHSELSQLPLPKLGEKEHARLVELRTLLLSEVQQMKGVIPLRILNQVLKSTNAFLAKPNDPAVLTQHLETVRKLISSRSKVLFGLSLILAAMVIAAFPLAWIFLTPLMPVGTVVTFAASLGLVLAVGSGMMLAWQLFAVSAASERLLQHLQHYQSQSLASSSKGTETAGAASEMPAPAEFYGSSRAPTAS